MRTCQPPERRERLRDILSRTEGGQAIPATTAPAPTSSVAAKKRADVVVRPSLSTVVGGASFVGRVVALSDPGPALFYRRESRFESVPPRDRRLLPEEVIIPDFLFPVALLPAPLMCGVPFKPGLRSG